MLLRAIALEPFGVPTGSMANTLYGNHKACNCPRCGYSIVVGSGLGSGKNVRDPYHHAFCPNCGESRLSLDSVRECIGDRLLVDKNVFELRRPRRWEVAVFRCPYDGNRPYVKRVIGLPGEKVLLQNGDVAINGELARKSFAELRAMRVPIFEQRFQPSARGWNTRWIHGPPEMAKPDPGRDAILKDASEYLDGGRLRWTRPDRVDWLICRNWLLDENHEAPLRDDFGYNGVSLPHRLSTVHDFCVEFDLEVGMDARSFAFGLRDGAADVQVEITFSDAGSKQSDRHSAVVRLVGLPERQANGQSIATADVRLTRGRRHKIELAFCDRRIMLAVDSDEVMTPVDLPVASHRNGVSRPLWLGGRGTLTVHDLRLFRDVHYAATGGECRNGVYEPWPLGANEYFVLGDNSANSQDSRFWTNAGIPEYCFMGKPLLLHQPSHWRRFNDWEIECINWRRVRWIR
jgi:signal peptidase I